MIQTKPSTPLYRNEWDRIFGQLDEAAERAKNEEKCFTPVRDCVCRDNGMGDPVLAGCPCVKIAG